MGIQISQWSSLFIVIPECLKVNGNINLKYIMHLLVVVGSKPRVMFCYFSPQIKSFPVEFVRSVNEMPENVVENITNCNFLAIGTRNENENLEYHMTLKLYK